jgi:A/G-specific adenine glycosylase
MAVMSADPTLASTHSPLLDDLVDWYDASARSLPWRTGDGPWGVLVSEIMLQQTPVARVLPVYLQWMTRWPTPGDLADAAPGEAIRAWGRLGYPRRALRLHAAAVTCRERYSGTVPSGVDDLRTLPGVGEYTAAAVAAFAYGQRHAVLDTNVRRVHARWLDGQAGPASATVINAERQRALSLLPVDPREASRVSIAVMELGALVCTARSPGCDRCPLVDACKWRAADYPAPSQPQRRTQTYDGTDRQCRGRLLEILRGSDSAVTRDELDAAWDDEQQRNRALDTLIADGLVVTESPSSFRLPG